MTRIIMILTLIVGMLLHLWPAQLNAGPLKNRSQIGLKFGSSFFKRDAAQAGRPIVANISGTKNLIVGFTYMRWLQENIAITFAITNLESNTSNTVWISGVSNESKTVVSFISGIRYYLPETSYQSAFRPYLAAGAGPVIWAGSLNEVGPSGVVNLNQTMTAFGSHFGGGMDVELNSHFMLGVNLGYNLMSNFSDIKVGRNNYSCFEFGLGLGFLWGGGVQEGD